MVIRLPIFGLLSPMEHNMEEWKDGFNKGIAIGLFGGFILGLIVITAVISFA